MDDKLENSVERALINYEERKLRIAQEEAEKMRLAKNLAAMDEAKGRVESAKVTIGQLMDQLIFPDIGDTPYDGTEILNDFGRMKAIADTLHMNASEFVTMLNFVVTRRYMMLLFAAQPNAVGAPTPRTYDVSQDTEAKTETTVQEGDAW